MAKRTRKSNNERPRPSFFIVGAPKCGTTALDDFLRAHPGIFMARKDPTYFNTDHQAESKRYHGNNQYYPLDNEKAYLECFADAQPGQVVGETTTEYLFSKTAPRNIKRFAPKAKIIIMLRDPVDFLHATHAEYIVWFQEDIEDFTTALNAESDRRKGRLLPSRISRPGKLYYRELAQLSKHVKRYLDVFGRENVLFIFFNDFKRDNAGTYKRVLEFIGADPSYKPSFHTSRTNRKLRFPRLRKLIESPVVWTLPKKLLPKNLYRKASAFFLDVITKKAPREQLSATLRSTLQRELRGEVAKLAKLTQQPLLERWGYPPPPQRQSERATKKQRPLRRTRGKQRTERRKVKR